MPTLIPSDLQPGHSVVVGPGPGHVGDELRTVDSVIWWHGLYRVEFTDGCARYYSPNRLLVVP